MAKTSALTVYLIAGETKTIGFDLQKKGPSKAGDTYSNPVFTITSGHGCVVGVPVINSTEFVDEDDGKPIPIGMGVIVKLDGTDAVPGTYDMQARANALPSGDKPKVAGRLIITDPVV